VPARLITTQALQEWTKDLGRTKDQERTKDQRTRDGRRTKAKGRKDWSLAAGGDREVNRPGGSGGNERSRLADGSKV
jgi:hypothetical protein